ncbi:hypothetical protein [Halorussus litoreus]|uniref:hypothetical protein n=1 Tax=Halorussus litoreus TaxID=1710536 RepID=UPI000E24C78D|nr:hypothetical protein [Halorussus litoreus]
MVWNRVDEAAITVQSDADGYSEGVTVVDGDSVHVDTHATASASASPSVIVLEYGPFEMYLDDAVSSANLENRRLRLDEMINRNTDETFVQQSWVPQGHTITAEVTVENGTAGDQVEVDFDGNVVGGDGNGTYTVPFTVSAEMDDLVGFEVQSVFGNSETYADVTFRLKKNVSASIDSTGVVTEDIHK